MAKRKSKPKPREMDVHGLVLKVLAGLVVLLVIVALCLPTSRPRTQLPLRLKTLGLMQAVMLAVASYQAESGHPMEVQSTAELVKVLQGDNPQKKVFFVFQSSELNARGELVDKWRMPMRISYDARKQLMLQSSGPDQVWNTPDDLSSDQMGF